LKDIDRTKEQLISELGRLRQRITELEPSRTHRKRVGQALAESEGMYRQLVEVSSDMIFTVDMKGSFLLTNKAFKKHLGYSGEEIRKINGFELVHPEDLDTVTKQFARLLEDKSAETMEYRYRTKKGSYISILNNASPVLDSEGNIVALLGIATNITERKRAEEELREHRDHLDELVKERTAQLEMANERLQRELAERKQVEEALRGSEERYRTILEEMQDGYYELDVAGNLTFFNDSLCRLFGYSREEMMGTDYRAYTPPEDVEAVFKKYNRVYRTGERMRGFPSRIIRKDGSVGFAETSAFPLRNQEGQIVGFRGIRRDVTERKEAEVALRQSEERYRRILEEMQDSYFETDLAGNFTFFNDYTCRTMGYSREELMGINYRVYVAPEDAERVYETFNQAYRTGKVGRTLVFKFLRKDGSTGYCELWVSPLRNDGGEITGFRGVNRDITERRLAEQALSDSEQRYRAIFEQAADSVVVIDVETGELVEFNDRAHENLGYTREEFGKLKIPDFEVIESGEEVARRIERIIKEGTHTFETKQRTKSGEIRDIQVSGRAISVGGKGFVQAIWRDITEPKRAQEERRALEQKAQLASRLASVGEMASGVAHEINNPLTGVIAYSQLLLQKKDIPEDVRKDLGTINDGAKRIADIVTRLLSFARQRKPRREYININEAIQSTLAIRGHSLQANNIGVTSQLPPDLPWTVADAGQLQQVFLNLIVNAETAMKLAHGRGSLLIETKALDDTIRISLEDNGPGIPEENLDRIFDPFFTTRDVGEGTGLGLSVCHGIIVEHNGRIYAESRLGKGATFIVELPIVAEAEQPELDEAAVEEAEKPAGAKILVVDDELVIREMVSRVLTDEGHEVDAVHNARDALKTMKSKRYSLILVDVKMPGMDGIELYEKMKKIAPSLARRAVFITGDVMGLSTQEFLSKTKAPCITKPFDAERLKAEVKRMLSGGR